MLGKKLKKTIRRRLFLLMVVATIGFYMMAIILYSSHLQEYSNFRYKYINKITVTQQTFQHSAKDNKTNQKHATKALVKVYRKAKIDLKEIKQRKQQIQMAKISNINCQKTRRPEHVEYNFYGKWQILRRGIDEILAYSAFYDDRTLIGRIPVIQILVVATNTKDIYCHIWYEGTEDPYVTLAESRASGRTDLKFDKIYGQYYFTCKLAKVTPIPTHVTLAGSKCGESTILLPIFHSKKTKWTVEFGICVAISFGNIPVNRFIEWMEMSMMLGIEEVHIYNATITQSILPTFQSYIKEKRLFVHDMPPPVKEWSKQGAKLGSPASMNDCMLRYMYRYRYIVVVDFDEIIVPQLANNYHDMIDHIKKEYKLQEDLPVYTFGNTYFLFEFQPDKAEPEYLIYLRYRHRAKPGAIGPDKSMVDPRRCLSVYNHHCYVSFPRIKHGRMFNVRATIGFTNHYKKCNLGNRCKILIKQKTKDDIMLKFKANLTERVNKRRVALNL